MTEALSYILLAIISGSLALFMAIMLTYYVTRAAVRLYKIDSKAHTKLIEACGNNEVNIVKYYMEPHTFTGKVIIEETSVYRDPKMTLTELYAEAFKSACLNEACDVVQYLIEIKAVKEAVIKNDFEQLLTDLCNLKNEFVIQLIQSHFSEAINEIENQDFILRLMINTGSVAIVRNYIAGHNLQSITCDHLNLACSGNNRSMETFLIFQYLFSQSNLQPNQIPSLFQGFQEAYEKGNFTIVQHFINTPELHPAVRYPGDDSTWINLGTPENSKSTLIALEHIARINPHFDLSKIVITMVNNLMTQFHIAEAQIYPTQIKRLMAMGDRHFQTLSNFGSIVERQTTLAYLAAACFIAEKDDKAWELLSSFAKKPQTRGGELIEKIIQYNAQQIIANINKIPLEFAIHLACLPAFRNYVLSNSNARNEFVQDKLLAHPVIQAYLAKELSPEAYAEKLQGLPYLQPDRILKDIIAIQAETAKDFAEVLNRIINIEIQRVNAENDKIELAEREEAAAI